MKYPLLASSCAFGAALIGGCGDPAACGSGRLGQVVVSMADASSNGTLTALEGTMSLDICGAPAEFLDLSGPEVTFATAPVGDVLAFANVDLWTDSAGATGENCTGEATGTLSEGETLSLTVDLTCTGPMP